MAASGTATKPVPQGQAPRNPISRRQVENVVSRSAAVLGIVFGAQTVPWLLGQVDEARAMWLWPTVIGLFGTLVLVLVLSLARVWVRPAHGLFAILYLVAIVSWPFAEEPGVEIFPGIHWLYYLLTVATSMAAVAFNWIWATVYLVVAPVCYLVIRATPAGGGASPLLATLEAVYAIILGGAVVLIVTMLRQASSSVDAAQATALDRYSHAVRQHATEVERVQVDAIVHDSVLTTLISAARAETPEARRLAVTMATNAIGHLRDAAATNPDAAGSVRFSTLAQRIADAGAELPGAIEVRTHGLGTQSMPAAAAEAVYSAAVQALVNSLAHAGDDGVRRWAAIRGVRPAGIEVVVGDTGRGFVLDEVPSERLGVRVSIVERVANSGGRAVIQSAPGEGTIVGIRWPSAAVTEPS